MSPIRTWVSESKAKKWLDDYPGIGGKPVIWRSTTDDQGRTVHEVWAIKTQDGYVTGLTIGATWVEISTVFNLVSGQEYVVNITEIEDEHVFAYLAETDDPAIPPERDAGRCVSPLAWESGQESRLYRQRAGRYAWMKVKRGTACVKIEEVS